MNFNWVNILATLLIVGGVALLVQKHMHGEPQRHVPTVEEAKADIERQIEGKLGRPLTEAETDMIEVTKKDSDQIDITLHEPLTGRLKEAVHNAAIAAAATAPSAQPKPALDEDLAHAAGNSVQMAPVNATTAAATSQP